MIRDASGNLYGTTRYGGAMGLSTVYKLDTSGHETALYSFKGGTDGYGPMSGLVLDPAGNLYGTMATANGCNCSGIVYKVDPSGNQTILYSFTDAVHGGFPSGGLIIDAAGNLYGTASFGGIIRFSSLLAWFIKSRPEWPGDRVIYVQRRRGRRRPLRRRDRGRGRQSVWDRGRRQSSGSAGLIFELDTSGRGRCCTVSPARRTGRVRVEGCCWVRPARCPALPTAAARLRRGPYLQ